MPIILIIEVLNQLTKRGINMIKLSKKDKAELENMLIDIQTDSYMFGISSHKMRTNDTLENQESHKQWLKQQQVTMRAIRVKLGLTSEV